MSHLSSLYLIPIHEDYFILPEEKSTGWRRKSVANNVILTSWHTTLKQKKNSFKKIAILDKKNLI